MFLVVACFPLVYLNVPHVFRRAGRAVTANIAAKILTIWNRVGAMPAIIELIQASQSMLGKNSPFEERQGTHLQCSDPWRIHVDLSQVMPSGGLE